jgi:integrase
LRASDLLFSEERIRAALAAEGMDERIADSMPHGAILWAAQHDKEGLLFITPISPEARAELDAYLRRRPRLGDVPLFPAPRDESKAIRRETAAAWLLKAEKLAKVPKLTGGVFHPFRRLFASERRHLPDLDVAAAAGWKDPQTMKRSYQQADAAGVLSAVRNTGS